MGPQKLGVSLRKSRFKKQQQAKSGDGGVKPLYHSGNKVLITHKEQEFTTTRYDSITEQNDLETFLYNAQMADQEFTAERMSTLKIVNVASSSTAVFSSVMSKEEEDRLKASFDANKDALVIPKRPPWDASTTTQELHAREKEYFVDWRRRLAQLEDRFILTPFEKNLEIWRQLWRVVERSDVVVQIVDSRNPVLFRSEDLDKYVCSVDREKREIPKKTMLLLNKADYLSHSQRKAWAQYFTENGISFVFFSAKNALLEEEEEEEEEDGKDEDKYEHEDQDQVKDEDEDQVKYEDQVMDDDEDEDQVHMEDKIHQEDDINDGTQILNREQLYQYLLENGKEYRGLEGGEKLRIGMVGYPNVGKSSTINALLGFKKVGVAATPGKTKHFQTIPLSHEIELYDCPGLVFPSFAATKAELVVNGVLPVDQLRDYIGPADLVASRIPRKVLETTYGIRLPLPEEHEDPNRAPVGLELLQEYAIARGFMRSVQGNPDESRAARVILKDYVCGKIRFCHSPPDFPGGDLEFNESSSHQHEIDNERDSNGNIIMINSDDNNNNNIKSNDERPVQRPVGRFDQEFFNQKHVKMHSLGKDALKDFRSRISATVDDSSSSNSDGSSLLNKNSKKHFKKNRRMQQKTK